MTYIEKTALDTKKIKKEILQLKKEHNAVILAHNYQIDEVQDIADFTGDSLELARKAANLDADLIVFCGVDFMAETAAILSPEKTVLLPAADASCPMAEMITAGELRVLKERFSDAAVVCYVNTSAEVKAESDICCTSSNAVKVVQSLDEDQVIFVPDRNLGSYVARFTDKKVMPWEGFCFVHDRITPEDVINARKLHPDADVLVHPECRSEVVDLADYVYSTSGMIEHVCRSEKKEFIIGTEVGIIHRMKKDCPDKSYYPLSEKAICITMKRTDLYKVHKSLESLTPRVTVPEDVAYRARLAIQRMLDIK
ncbi:quinolinate synthase NadA [Methanolobus sp.]|jgi:quinolinate synthase|uniref:quinolinate synthase NadA n=1 Tax=Methanolobus sp. TaxID=1874737 RepID=UPI0025FE4A2B|nr:quinolinate synthase NadA [Methanolobus sp.]